MVDPTMSAAYKQLWLVLAGCVIVAIVWEQNEKVGGMILAALVLMMLFRANQNGALNKTLTAWGF